MFQMPIGMPEVDPETRHEVRVPDEDASDTVKVAGELLAAAVDASETSKLADEEIGHVVQSVCTDASQLERCKKEGTQESLCKDKCCLDSCRAYASKQPSCLKLCTGSFKFAGERMIK